MKVSELIDRLKNCDMNAEVILQIDPEGNGYHEVRGADEVVCVKDGRDMDVYSKEDSASDHCLEEDEWEKFKLDPKYNFVVIWP